MTWHSNKKEFSISLDDSGVILYFTSSKVICVLPLPSPLHPILPPPILLHVINPPPNLLLLLLPLHNPLQLLLLISLHSLMSNLLLKLIKLMLLLLPRLLLSRGRESLSTRFAHLVRSLTPNSTCLDEFIINLVTLPSTDTNPLLLPSYMHFPSTTTPSQPT